MNRMRRNLAALTLLPLTALAACSSVNQSTGSSRASEALTIRQPTFAELSRFLPGGVPGKGAPPEAPLPCGGSMKSVRIATTAIEVRDSLLALSVSEYRFATATGVGAYIHAIQNLHGPDAHGQIYCVNTDQSSGARYQASGAFLANDGYYLLAADTKHGRGIYSGTYSYTTIAYVVNGDVVYLVRADRQAGHANLAFMGGLFTSLETPGGPALNTGGHSAKPSSVTAVIHRARYGEAVGGANPAVTEFLCPVATIGSTPYNLTFERQLPHSTPDGLVVPGPRPGTSTTVRWGSTVRLVVDTFNQSENEPYSPCENGNSQVGTYADIISMSSAK